MKSSNSSNEAKIVNKLMSLLNKNKIDKIAHSTGFINRKRKLTGFAFIFFMIFEVRKTKMESLNDLCIKLESEKIFISKQGVSKRFDDSAVEFMKEVTYSALAKKLNIKNELKDTSFFNRIIVKDSTVFQLPAEYSEVFKGSGGGASKAGIKIQWEYNLIGDSGLDIEILPSSAPDITSRLHKINANDLRLEDLGYFKLIRFGEIIRNQAYFLSRLKFGILVYTKKGDQYIRINLDELVKKMRVGQMLEIEVYLGQKEKLPVRLILERVPDQIAATKRRKLKTDKQNKRKGISKNRLAFCDVNAYITNAEQDILPTDLVRSIYSLRWQIEIIFKTWKSTFNIDKVKPMKIQRFECVNYGTLLQIIICTKLFIYYKTTLWKNQKIELSELKSFKYLIEKLEEIRDYIKENKPIELTILLVHIKEVLARRCIKENKKGRLIPLDIISKTSLS